jgi:hypothetical protein
MMHRMCRPIVVFGLLLVGAGIAAVGVQGAGSHDLVLSVDGGFAYIFAASGGRVDLASIVPVSGVPDHVLRLGVDRSTDYDHAKTTVAPQRQFGKLTWDLSGYDAVILPGGKPATGAALVVPAASAPASCGAGIPAPTGSAANNLNYLVDLGDLAPGSTVDDTAIAGQLALTTGTLSIDSVGYCWQFESGTTKKTPLPLARGIKGISYKLANNESFVDIQLTKRGTPAAVQVIRLLPGTGGVIRGRLSTAFATPMPHAAMVKPGAIDDHFRMFYSLAKSNANTSAQSRFMPRFVVGKVPQSPGDDCLSARIRRP